MSDRTIPTHIAVIPDGNRRWAKERGKTVYEGHKEGVETFRRLIASAADRGIKFITFYAFSTENWKRTAEEVSGLMKLMLLYIKNFDKVMGDSKSKVRFIIAGDKLGLSKELQAGIADIESQTKDNRDITVIICMNYGGRDEIVASAKTIANEVREGRIQPEDISEEMIGSHLYVPGIPEPDLMIRTSGEMRISNFLLWELAYAEFYFADVNWPDFDAAELDKALDAYAKRQRRYGN